MSTNAKLRSPQDSLRALMDGNARFINGLRSIHTMASVAKLKELAEKGQAPLATIITCSDSRVPAEILFDCGVGDLFVIRTAGNTVSPETLASLEYAIAVLQTPLAIVMGHSGCGAVNEAISFAKNEKDTLSDNLKALLKQIVPAVERAMKTEPQDRESLAQEATIQNVLRSVELIQERSKVVQTAIKSNRFVLTSALYELHSGLVNFEVTASSQKIMRRKG